MKVLDEAYDPVAVCEWCADYIEPNDEYIKTIDDIFYHSECFGEYDVYWPLLEHFVIEEVGTFDEFTA